jgi:uncharacterized protein YggE
MQNPVKLFAPLALAAVVTVSGFALQSASPLTQPVQAQSVPAAPARTITVVGEGKVNIEPDVAQVNFGVEVLAPSVREALDENSATMDGVLAALQAQGIAEEDIQTSGFSIYAERYGPQGPLPEDEVNYRVNNNVLVKIRDLESIGAVVDAAVEAGANNIYGIEFRVDDPSVLESDARRAAIEDAQAKAAELAELTGTTVGQVVSVSEIIGAGLYSPSFAVYDRAMGGGAAAPIAPGQLELTMQIQVTYALGE